MLNEEIELLAPCGDMESVFVAIDSGANAIYLGVKRFNARVKANNFDLEELEEIIKYAHNCNVKVYLTLNTLILDKELADAILTAVDCFNLGIDAIIVQDIGLAFLINDVYPEIEIHASTQMTVYNIDGLKFLKEMGFSRAVLSRENSINEIEEITCQNLLEVEVFIHGSLCISYSGQCLMSSFIGGRSGNRGKCAQACRLPYQLISKENINRNKHFNYPLSPKDLCSMAFLETILKLNVRALKIEGRMKSTNYVKAVVSLYRKNIDNICNKSILNNKNSFKDNVSKDIIKLKEVFSRAGFTSGYYFGRNGFDLLSYDIPGNQGLFIGTVKKILNKNCVLLKVKESISIHDKLAFFKNKDKPIYYEINSIKFEKEKILTGSNDRLISIVFNKTIDTSILGEKAYKIVDNNIKSNGYKNINKNMNKNNNSKIALFGKINIKKNEVIEFWVQDIEKTGVYINLGIVPEKSVTREILKSEIIKQLNKTKDTSFFFMDIAIDIDKELYISQSVINSYRRSALEEMEKVKTKISKNKLDFKLGKKYLENFFYSVPKDHKIIDEKSRNTKNKKVSLYFYKLNPIFLENDFNVDRIYISLKDFIIVKDIFKYKMFRNKETEIYLHIPTIIKGKYKQIIEELLNGKYLNERISGFLIGNIADIYRFKGTHFNLVGDFTLNAINSASIELFKQKGLKGLTLSLELNGSQINALKVDPLIDKELVLYGKIPVMTMENCIGKTYSKINNEGCKKCHNGDLYLKDRKNKNFEILCDNFSCNNIIFNSNKLLAWDYLDYLNGNLIDLIRLNIYDESPEDIKEIIKYFRYSSCSAKKEEKSKIINDIIEIGYTRGHYLKGV